MSSSKPNTLYDQMPNSLLHLCRNIEACFMSGDGSNKTMNEVCKVLQKFDRLSVEELINSILGNNDLLYHISKNTYLHKNGFYKILLLNEKNFALRLHIWMPGITAEETLHNHCWHMASTVIAGELKSEVWQESASIAANYCDEYMYINKHVNPTYLGKVKVELVETIIHKAGQAYVLAPSVLHRLISQETNIVATLICRSAKVQSWARNIIVNDRVPDVKPNYLNTEEVGQVLRKYLKLTAN